MIDIEAKKRLISKRVASLAFEDSVLEEASRIIISVGMKLPDAASALRKEWLNDMVATTEAAEFRHAIRDPGAHFLNWVRERAKHPYHVTYRAVRSVSQRFGPEIAAKMTHVIWPQEIAWAQRLRLSDNPHIATKAALFLRDAEGNPAKVFQKISDLYSEAATTVDYFDNPVHEISPSEIRFMDELPEFNPLFLRYVTRSFSDVLHTMTRERIELLATRAAKDERREKALISAHRAVQTTRKFPMRRVLSIMLFAINNGISPNELYLLEGSFLQALENGDIELEQGSLTPQVAFISSITTKIQREKLLLTAPVSDFEPNSMIWTIANMDKRWLDEVPESYRKWSSQWATELPKWQISIVEEDREAPHDPISDFGFWLMQKEFS